MTLDEPEIASIAAFVREQLPAGESRIQTKPIKCRDAWWPQTSGFTEESRAREIQDEVQDEIRAIEECLKRLEGFKEKRIEEMSEQDFIDALSDQMSRRSTALALWDHIAFPLRHRDGLVYRVGPRTNFDVISADQFVRLVTLQTVHFKRDLIGQAKEIRFWRTAFGALVIVILLIVLWKLQFI